MKNPVYIEYRRSTKLGIILLLLLSTFGALVHYFRSVDDKVLQTKLRLAAASNQVDSEFVPILAFMEAVRRASLLKLSIPAEPTEDMLPLLQLDSGVTEQASLMQLDGTVNAELMMLQRLQPYFELAKETQPYLVGMYYLSEQGFAYNGQLKWSDYIADYLVQWQKDSKPEPNYERGQIFFSSFLQQQAAVMLPLYADDKKLGRFVFAIELAPLLAPIYQQHKDAEFMLLDQFGQLISNSMTMPVQNIDQHMLQVQRLSSMPWSLGLLEHKANVFAAGVKEFVWHWLSYAVLFGVFLYALQYRYRLRILSPSKRLLVHIERLSKGSSQGVQRIPYGWHDIFERISRLRQNPPS
ncbi:hypothetical protein E0Z06_01700 [Rheinheimera sp. D18]|uniref:cache domain-containing protein n=1 Tax=Rheinheimera sp. D18 TaxID=2545632 RepID=UPI0010489976|nr:cache domain-containing protein [Rheinheimera sp. D18]QBL08321.1 hypothetical protein E0Z06_01700 [Rheinheimera sp. D18]